MRDGVLFGGEVDTVCDVVVAAVEESGRYNTMLIQFVM